MRWSLTKAILFLSWWPVIAALDAIHWILMKLLKLVEHLNLKVMRTALDLVERPSDPLDCDFVFPTPEEEDE